MEKIASDMDRKATLLGVAAGVSLLVSYFVIVGALNGFGYAVDRFVELWFLMAPLAVGFGFQVGLFSYVRSYSKMSGDVALGSSGTSAVSMIACCVHHLTDVLPVLGISALGMFLFKYQPALLATGLVSNLIGIIFIFNVANKSGVRFKNGFLRGAEKHGSAKVLRMAIIAGVAIVMSAFLVVRSATLSSAATGSMVLQPLTSESNSITVTVTPIVFGAQSPEEFNISIDNHAVQLDADLRNTSILFVGGNEFAPTSWRGISYMGGHHVRGTLMFEPLGEMPQNLTLVIRNVSGADRVFRWNLSPKK